MRRPGPGKFEGCEDERLAQALYNILGISGESESLGDVEGFGFFALIESRKPGRAYIVNEDSYGFFDYGVFEGGAARQAWADLEKDYEEWNDHNDAMNDLADRLAEEQD